MIRQEGLSPSSLSRATQILNAINEHSHIEDIASVVQELGTLLWRLEPQPPGRGGPMRRLGCRVVDLRKQVTFDCTLVSKNPVDKVAPSLPVFDWVVLATLVGRRSSSSTYRDIA